MIWIDKPQTYQVKHLMRGRKFTSSHLFSDKPGKQGTRELITFAAKIGLKPEWLQKPGTYQEHFDVMNARYGLAIQEGAQKAGMRKELETMLAKRPSLARVLDV